MTRPPIVPLALALTLASGCHLLFPHAPGEASAGLDARPRIDGAAGGCGSCEFNPTTGTTCEGAGLTAVDTTVPSQALLRISLAPPPGPCSELELEAELEDPKPSSSSDSWLLDLGDSASNNGFGGDALQGDDSFANDSELELVKAGSGWTLTLWSNDYYLDQHPNGHKLGSVGGFVPATGKSKLTILVGHHRAEAVSEAGVKLTQVFTPQSSGDPAAPCSFFCLYQKDKYNAKAPDGDGLLWLGLHRTIGFRAGSSSSGIVKARIRVR